MENINTRQEGGENHSVETNIKGGVKSNPNLKNKEEIIYLFRN